MTEITPKQALFVSEYLIDLNATQAAIRAGYSAKTAHAQGPRLLDNVGVRAAIDAAIKDRSERVKIDADYVLKQAVKLHERCMQEIEPFTDKKGNQICDADGRPIFIFNAAGAASALTLVGKHVKVNAFQEIVQHKGLEGLAGRLARAKSKRNGDG